MFRGKKSLDKIYIYMIGGLIDQITTSDLDTSTRTTFEKFANQ